MTSSTNVHVLLDSHGDEKTSSIGMSYTHLNMLMMKHMRDFTDKEKYYRIICSIMIKCKRGELLELLLDSDDDNITEFMTFSATQCPQTLQYSLELIFKRLGYKEGRRLVLNGLSKDGLAFQHVTSHPLASDKEIIETALHQNVHAFQFVAKSFHTTENLQMIKRVLSRCGWLYQFLDERLLSNRELTECAAKQNGHTILFMESSLGRNDHEWFQYLKQKYALNATYKELQQVKFYMTWSDYDGWDSFEGIFTFEEIIAEAENCSYYDVKRGCGNLSPEDVEKYATELWKRETGQQNLIPSILEQFGSSNHFQFPPHYQNLSSKKYLVRTYKYSSEFELTPPYSRDSVLEAVKKNGETLRNVSKEFTKDREIVLTAARTCGYIVQYADKSVAIDREITLAAVSNDGLSLSYCGFRNDREVILAAVSQNGEAIKYASSKFVNDKEIALAAVKSNGESLKYFSSELRNDKQVVMAAVSRKNSSIAYASPTLKGDREVVLRAVSHSPNSIFLTNMTHDKQVVMTAVSKDAKIFNKIDNKFKKDLDVVRAVASTRNIEIVQELDVNIFKDELFVLKNFSYFLNDEQFSVE